MKWNHEKFENKVEHVTSSMKNQHSNQEYMVIKKKGHIAIVVGQIYEWKKPKDLQIKIRISPSADFLDAMVS